MSVFKNHVNLGVNELWAQVYENFTPYEDRVRSTNVREFTRDTTLDAKAKPFKTVKLKPEEPFVLDTKLSGGVRET